MLALIITIMLSNLLTDGKSVAQTGTGMSPVSLGDSVAERGLAPRSSTSGPAARLSLLLVVPLLVAGGPALVLMVLGQSHLASEAPVLPGCSHH